MSNLKCLRIMTVRCTTCNYELNKYAQSCSKNLIPGNDLIRTIWFLFGFYRFFVKSTSLHIRFASYTTPLPLLYYLFTTGWPISRNREESNKPVKFNDQGILTSCLQCKILSKNRNMHNNIKCHFPIGNIILWNASFGSIMRYRYNIFNF